MQKFLGTYVLRNIYYFTMVDTLQGNMLPIFADLSAFICFSHPLSSGLCSKNCTPSHFPDDLNFTNWKIQPVVILISSLVLWRGNCLWSAVRWTIQLCLLQFWFFNDMAMPMVAIWIYLLHIFCTLHNSFKMGE